MGFYDEHILPTCISFACGLPQIQKCRSQLVPQATGSVLEIGFGSGLNIPFYDHNNISHLYALEPSHGMRRKAEPKLKDIPFSVDWLDLPGEEIPLDNESVDSVLVTFTLCTIPDVALALNQMHRVLKPSGKLVFLEHGIAPDKSVAATQNRLNGIWGKFAGGCHLNRNPVDLVEKAGFKTQDVQARYLPKSPKFASFVTQGVASQ